MSRRSTRSLLSRSARSRSSSRFSCVEGNFRVDTPIIPEVIVQTRPKTREITINDAPMMLLPKARVRDSPSHYDKFRRSYTVVEADAPYQGLHISTIQSVDGMVPRQMPRSALKQRKESISRSEADSGFCSLKRSVTFDNLSRSQSTVFRSDDEFENLSESSYDETADTNHELFHHNNALEDVDLSDHLDSFGDNSPVISRLSPHPPPKTVLPVKRRRHGEGDHNVEACEICGVILSDTERVQRSFGKVDSFLSWVMVRWGKRGELQYVQRPSSSRGHRPHFCNFVHQMHLHNKKTDETESTGVPDSEASENVDFIMESAEGRLINKYRKDSNHSSNSSLHRGLLKSPKLEDYEKDSIPEMKEEILLSGTEGRPGSPSSLDGDSCHGDVEDGNFTGIEVRVTSPVKFEQALVSKPKSDLTKHKPKREDHSECGGWRTGEPAPILEEVGDTDGGRTPADGPTPWDDSKSRKSVDSGSAGPSEGSRTERPPSPREPPPSPEPVQKAPPPTQAPARQPQTRGCVKKKTKKPIERIRTEKKMEEVTEAPPPVEEHPSSQDIPTDSEKVKPEVDIKVPELPSNVEKERSGRKEKAKHKRHQIEVEDDLVKPDIGEILNDQIKLSRPEFDWSNMDNNGVDDIKRPPQIKSWIQGRLALSQQSSRFELPMDMKLLEKMTPQEYIKKHCIITSRRQNLYQKIFLKNKDKTHTILIKDIDRSLKDVLVNTITSEQISDILHTLDIDENTKIDFKLFCGMAAYAERVLYPKFVTDDTHDMPEYQREKIECADFGALDWKIHGVKVPPKMLEVLREIC
ncbi:uncharacterized protein LOC128231412 isoform X3 [Mya arenaria]|uniref:uncharacterized protein LOC128231412 isoform X3 n=1 Tax=Mya arenaria TaxID=6604 RepID=UPI0022E4C46D|nr:uncharacterized protein LOC128231412 isoform X3 [Mya arenaria]